MPTLHQGLLISTRRNFEKNASSEIHFTLTKELGIPADKIKARNTNISGLITVKLVEQDILDVMVRLIKLEEEKPYFMHCLKIKPIFHQISAELELLSELIDTIVDEVEGKFKIEINKRHAHLSSKDIIRTIATKISKPVDLDNPDTVILVEILGDKLGLSIIKPKFIYSTIKSSDEQIKSSDEENWFLS